MAKKNSEKKDLYSIPIDDFFKSAFSVDCVIFGYHDKELKVLLIQRGTSPFEGDWALPGDLVYPHEDLDSAADRVLMDLTQLEDISMRQVKSFGKVNRHPLGRVITVAYFALLELQEISPMASSWAKDIKWHSVKRIPKLAFDHKEILTECLDSMRELIKHEPIWTRVLSKKFTLTELQELFETILMKKYDKGNFRKKVSSMKFLKRLEESQINVRHRPSALYKFDHKTFLQYRESGNVVEF
jgi:8-oxo-dGTP diphosphatase